MIGLPLGAAERRLLDSGRRTQAMRWVMGVMVYLTVLATALGLGTTSAATRLDRDLAGRVTVQLLAPVAGTTERLIRTLGALPEVRAVRPVPRAELARLLQPWLGDAGLDPELPMPVMIDLDLADPGEAALDRVVAQARAIAPDATVDRHAKWLAPVRGFIVVLAWLAIGVVLLMASATAAVVLLTARAGLDTHRDTIDVLHMLGSTDTQIARLFQRRIALDTLIGGGVGALLGLGTVALVETRIAALGSEVIGQGGLGVGGWIALAALPFAFAALATLAARIAVVGALRRVL